MSKRIDNIPKPAHPDKRESPLPWHQPKPGEEDPSVAQRITAILQSPSYEEGDQDKEFLNRADTRGVRLQVDYLKAELILKKHNIEKTIVVFGSTRIPEPASAQHKVDKLRSELKGKGELKSLKRQLDVAERILNKSQYYEISRELGRLISQSSDLVVVTGGGPGIMEAANRGADDVNAQTIGLNVGLPHQQYPNPYITPDLCFQFHYFAIRKLHFLLRAKALVVFPGGYGTFDELFETLTLIQTRKIKPVPVVLVGESYWRQAFNVDFLVDEGVIDEEDRELFWYAESAEEIWEGIRHWYEVCGEPLLSKH
jgi:uncharacterized protein (TIGR00730 family)